VLFRVRIEVLDDVVALRLEQMAVLVLAKVVMNFFTGQEACRRSVESTECCIRFKARALGKGLPLSFDALLLFRDGQEEIG